MERHEPKGFLLESKSVINTDIRNMQTPPAETDDENVQSLPPSRQLRKRNPIQQAPYSIERIRARNAGIPIEVDEKVLRRERESGFDKERYNYEAQEDGFVVCDSDEEGRGFDTPDSTDESSPAFNKRPTVSREALVTSDSENEPAPRNMHKRTLISLDGSNARRQIKRPRVEKNREHFIHPDSIDATTIDFTESEGSIDEYLNELDNSQPTHFSDSPTVTIETEEQSDYLSEASNFTDVSIIDECEKVDRSISNHYMCNSYRQTALPFTRLSPITSPLSSVRRVNESRKKETSSFDRRLKINLQWAKESSVPSVDNPLFKEYTVRWLELFHQLTFAISFNRPWPPEIVRIIEKLILQFKSMRPNNSNIEEPYKILCALIKNFPKVKNSAGEIRAKSDKLSIPSMIDVFYTLNNTLIQSITKFTPKKFLREYQVKSFEYIKELYNTLDNKTTSYYRESHERMTLVLGDSLKLLSPRENIIMLDETLGMFIESLNRINVLSESTVKELINIHKLLISKFNESAEDETDLRVKIKNCLRAIKSKMPPKKPKGFSRSQYFAMQYLKVKISHNPSNFASVWLCGKLPHVQRAARDNRLASENSRRFIKFPSQPSPFIQYRRSFQSFSNNSNDDKDSTSKLLESLFKNISPKLEDPEQTPKKDDTKSILDNDFKNLFFTNVHETPEQVKNEEDNLIEDSVSMDNLFLREEGTLENAFDERSGIEILEGDKNISNLDDLNTNSGMRDPSIILLTDLIMKDGKKARAQRYVSDCCLEIRKQTNNNPYKIIKAAIEKASPLVGHLSFKKGSKAIQIPCPLNERQKHHKAIKWILKASDKRPGKKFSNRLALEILAVINGQSQALQQKDAVHKLALANRENLPIKW
ncbi:18930_t:CDS:2 [Acaulospora morrowiae]|uniref:18930_t:CDS:1 n=1 Tax=Acaulospora morrowiae TaxID=94023 RepID=A0A9N9C4C3_9GLOM|nr:18930_t:CDS:2 [Acaulospora morrowiae]